MSLITPRPDPNVKTVKDLVPVHEHPPAAAINAIHRAAKQQMKEMWETVDGSLDTNARARYLRANLTPEQLYIYEWISYIFIIMSLPYETFARQVGVSVQSLKGWLFKRGHMPSRTHFKRLLSIYQANFCDDEARELFHGAKIGEWHPPTRPMSEIIKEKWKNAGYKVNGKQISSK